VGDFVSKVLRRLLVRGPASPSIAKLVLMLLGLWTGCAIVFGLALAAGLDPSRMSLDSELLLFGSFVLMALGAFALATTEPR
jgi:hypothetical protein